MTSYVDVFGGDTVPPSDNRYVAVALTASTTFYWPEQASGPDLMADIMEVTPDAAWDMTFPDATVVSTGRDVLVRNLGAFTITLKDSVGGTIGTVAAGVAKYIYLTSNATAAGTWTIFTFGTGTSAADAATLAGYGLVATGSTLSQQALTVSSAVTTTVLTSQRAETLIFTNSGVVTCDMPLASSAGNGFFINISNQGTGTVTIDPSGAETIDGETTKDLAPGESLTAVCSGTAWAAIGYGRSTQFQFTKLVLDISAGTPFTLTSVQAANKLIQTIGTITGNVIINVPAVVAIYYIECSHTGAFTTTIKTAAGVGIALSAGDRSILYCDGVDIVQAQTSAAPVANITGGSAGVVPYQSGVGTTSFTAVGTTAQLLASGGTGVPTWTDIGLTTFGYSSKATPVDADSIPLSDSAAANGPKKLTWANLKATFLGTANTFTAAQTITAASPSPLAINSTQAAVNAGVRLDTNKADSSVAWMLSNSQAGVNRQASAVLRNADGGYAVYVGQTAGAQSTSGTQALTVTPTLVGTISSAVSVGYGTGAGGTVTQATSKATAVTLNKPTGQITMHNAALNAGAVVGFTVNNSLVAATDTVLISIKGGTAVYTSYVISTDGIFAGVFNVGLRNLTAGSLSEAIILNFAIIKGVTS